MAETNIIRNLSDYSAVIKSIRSVWSVPPQDELWFRGERRKYATYLRPNLYRPTGKYVDIDVPKLLSIENRLYDRFIESAAPLTSEMPPDNDAEWAWYFIMQHHGAPNRLLDWTEGALIALHFAIRDVQPLPSKRVPRRRNNPRVYVIEPVRLQAIIKADTTIETVKTNWQWYLQRHPELRFHDGLSDEDWEDSYLPVDEE